MKMKYTFVQLTYMLVMKVLLSALLKRSVISGLLSNSKEKYVVFNQRLTIGEIWKIPSVIFKSFPFFFFFVCVRKRDLPVKIVIGNNANNSIKCFVFSLLFSSMYVLWEWLYFFRPFFALNHLSYWWYWPVSPNDKFKSYLFKEHFAV